MSFDTKLVLTLGQEGAANPLTGGGADTTSTATTSGEAGAAGSEGGATGGGGFSMGQMLIPMVLLLFVFMMFSGSRKEKKRRAALLAALRPGATVITNGGIKGVVREMDDTEVLMEFESGKARVLKQAIAQVTTQD